MLRMLENRVLRKTFWATEGQEQRVGEIIKRKVL
jgi:hypothetical protein